MVCRGQTHAHTCVFAATFPPESIVMSRTARETTRSQHTDAESYVPRGSECAYANLKLLARAVSTIYDEALRPAGLRASQLALLWAIAASEPVELGRLGMLTLTDQTTLSRTVEKLRRERWVSVRPGDDRRVKMISLTAAGRRRFVLAMPLWDVAQKRADELLPLDDVRSMARRVRKLVRVSA
jgi:DNA-binding MarR family transcriptional regulator